MILISATMSDKNRHGLGLINQVFHVWYKIWWLENLHPSDFLNDCCVMQKWFCLLCRATRRQKTLPEWDKSWYQERKAQTSADWRGTLDNKKVWQVIQSMTDKSIFDLLNKESALAPEDWPLSAGANHIHCRAGKTGSYKMSFFLSHLRFFFFGLHPCLYWSHLKTGEFAQWSICSAWLSTCLWSSPP